MNKETGENEPVQDVSNETQPSGPFDTVISYARSAELDISLRESTDGKPVARLVLGNADSGKQIIRLDPERAELLASFYFADWVFADGLVAVYDPHDELIEVAVEPVSKYMRYGIRRLQELAEREASVPTTPDEFDEIISEDSDKDESKELSSECIKFRTTSLTRDVELSPPTNRAFAIPGYSSVPVSLRTKYRAAPTIKIRNVRLSKATPKDVTNIVEGSTNDIFVELDLAHGIAYRVVRRHHHIGRMPKDSGRRGNFNPATLPRRSYSREASSLYFYARSSDGVPLLQYLAYYQVAEYFFPKFWQAEITQKVQNILYDPTFSSDNERDIQRIIGIVGKSGRRVGSELEALRHTISACCDEDSTVAFLKETEKRQDFFEKDRSIKAVRHINVRNKNELLSSQVADRIYELRCRIVHSKENGDVDKVDPLLPFSEEARRLSFDIDLVEFVAQKVLIATSTGA